MRQQSLRHATFQPARGRCVPWKRGHHAHRHPDLQHLSLLHVLSQDVRTNGMLKVGYDVTDRLKLTPTSTI